MAFSLSAVFGIDATGVKTELKQLRKEVGDFASSWANIGAAAAGAAFVALSKSAIDLASHISDTSINLGISAKAYQVLAFSAEQAGLSNEKFDASLSKIRGTVIAASEGNKQAAESLAKLGLNFRQLIGLPLEQQYLKIANGAKNATDKNEAFNAVTTIFGEKVGRQMMTVLTELADEGYPKAAKAAADAGQVMSNETIVALERAGDAIEAFKKKATIAVGNIIVNFRSEEGLMLLGLQLLKVVGVFGGKILDAVSEANDFLGAVFTGTFKGVVNIFRDGMVTAIESLSTQLNKILPKKFQIDVESLERLKSSGEGIADSIARAISETKPSTFSKDAGAFYDKLIVDQQKIVDQLNKIDLGKDAAKLENAGKGLERSGKVTADAIVDGAKIAGNALIDASKIASGGMIGALNGKTLAGLSDAALESLIRQDKAKTIGKDEGTAFNYGDSFELNRLKNELNNAQKELDIRNNFKMDISGPGGIEANRDRYDPMIFEKLLQQFGPGAADTNNRIANGIDKLNSQLNKGVPTVLFGTTTG